MSMPFYVVRLGAAVWALCIFGLGGWGEGGGKAGPAGGCVMVTFRCSTDPSPQTTCNPQPSMTGPFKQNQKQPIHFTPPASQTGGNTVLCCSQQNTPQLLRAVHALWAPATPSPHPPPFPSQTLPDVSAGTSFSPETATPAMLLGTEAPKMMPSGS